MNIYFTLILAILVIDFLVDRWLDFLNLRNFSMELPEEVKGIYDEDKYRKSMEYYRANQRLGMITSTFSLTITLAMLLSGGFGFLDEEVRRITAQPVFSALLFFGIIGLGSDLLFLPFALYKTFVIEEKFGFNKTTPKTFVLDKLKGYLLAAIIGGGLVAIVVNLYETLGRDFWWIAWLVLAVIMLFATLFYTSWILPLFNKLRPLQEGELRSAIEHYCNRVGFRLQNLFVMDGSKRSTHANAFFSGLGPKKKIVLFDTLIEKHSVEELVAVIAHEVGHYKKKHTLTGLISGLCQTGLMLFILSLFVGNPELASALGASQNSFQIDIIGFGILYSPLSQIFGIAGNVISRKHEYQADAYARFSFNGDALAAALKKLSVDNLSNLTPHPAYVFVYYSHPTLLQRLKMLKK